MNDLIDIGANLGHDSFDMDREAVLARARDAGVRRLIVTGTTLEASRRAHELTVAAPGTLFATAGIHPHHATEYGLSTSSELKALARNPSVVAIGECGLDYFRNFSPPAAQRDAFAAQLELAVETGLPAFLHQRDAHAEFTEMLFPYRDRLSGGVAHCFTEGIEVMTAYLDLGLHIGITGWVCDERRGEALQAAVPHLPLDRLLLETDAPYLLPRTLRPRPKTRRNEPAWLPEVAAKVASLMRRPVEEVVAAATANTVRLFRLNERQ